MHQRNVRRSSVKRLDEKKYTSDYEANIKPNEFGRHAQT